MDVDRETLLNASVLREKYSLSFWDSTIVACALRSNCGVLYTEDMQAGLTVEGTLAVANRFEATQPDHRLAP